jgi:hypothetical protein
MGLLDEAIREHLELKRRGGGDPTEIAHQEREALEPIFPDPGAPGGDPPAEARPAGEEEGAAFLPDSQAGLADGSAPEEPPAEADFSSVAQETAELDMQAVLDADGMLDAEPDGAAEPAPAAPRAPEGDSVEWEAPSDGP